MITWILHVLGIRPNLVLALSTFDKLQADLDKVAASETVRAEKAAAKAVKMQEKAAASLVNQARATQVRSNIQNLLAN
jgi:hypothetical protein